MEFLKRKKRERERQKRLSKANTSTNVNALGASYPRSHLTTKADKAFAIRGKHYICLNRYLLEHLGEAVGIKLTQMSFSARTASRRIEDIAEDIETQLLERIVKSPWFAIHYDECTGIDNKVMLLVYVRYPYQKKYS